MLKAFVTYASISIAIALVMQGMLYAYVYLSDTLGSTSFTAFMIAFVVVSIVANYYAFKFAVNRLLG